MEITHIANVLREYELYCYQAAFYILMDEQGAALATQRALIELGSSLQFLKVREDEQLNIVKKTILKHSLITASQGELSMQ